MFPGYMAMSKAGSPMSLSACRITPERIQGTKHKGAKGSPRHACVPKRLRSQLQYQMLARRRASTKEDDERKTGSVSMNPQFLSCLCAFGWCLCGDLFLYSPILQQPIMGNDRGNIRCRIFVLPLSGLIVGSVSGISVTRYHPVRTNAPRGHDRTRDRRKRSLRCEDGRTGR